MATSGFGVTPTRGTGQRSEERDLVRTTPRDDDLFMRTRRLSRVATEIYDEKLQSFGLGAVQFALLQVIDLCAPITRAEVARKLDLDKSTLTRDLRSVFLSGWVKEVREGANGRSKPIALTQAGKQLLLDAASAWLAAQTEATALLRQHGFVGTDKFIASNKNAPDQTGALCIDLQEINSGQQPGPGHRICS